MHEEQALARATSLRPHGGVRGDELPPGSALSAGRFGRMFRRLPAATFTQTDLMALAKAMTAEQEDDPTPESRDDDEENPGIDAGYTYLGQFIDHDLTFDPVSSLQKTNDPDALNNFRTPRFDLDSVYGRGPHDQPYLYEDDALHLQLGRRLSGSELDPNTRDLPRHKSNKNGARARALIGDPRNDENVIISQLHGIMLRFHNRMAQHCGAKNGRDFERVQRLVRWHYQWVVLHDFLPTIVGQEMVHKVLPHLKSGKSIYDDRPQLHFFKWDNNQFIPIEFSAAAYRFGHSMVRPIYRLNTTLVGEGEDHPINGRRMIFTPDDGEQGLNGFREFPSQWAIDWRLFFKMDPNSPATGVRRVQKAYKIDTSVVNPLAMLPRSIVATDERSLAHRNLERGLRMCLPAGQAVARYMHVEPLSEDKLRVGKATEDAFHSNPCIADISPRFADNAPLWYYVLAEAQNHFRNNTSAIRLGDVGGRIVAEVFVGLLLGDQYSYLSQNPGWKPNDAGQFKMADLIRIAIEA
jgi:hypothetical protein